MEPLVSVIMPCFNDGKYILQSIESVRKQTFKELELIIIDDGSTDFETVEIINKIENEMIKVVRTENIGPAGARNLGINIAKGKYILPLDADDLIHETYIEKAFNVIESNIDIGIVYCEAELFGEKSGKWELADFSIEEMLYSNVIFVTAMFRKSDWQTVGGFDVNLKKGIEDYDFWLSILGIGRKVIKIPEILFYYRIKKVSRSTKFSDDRQAVLDTYNKIYKKHKKLYIENLDNLIPKFRYKIEEERYKLERVKNIIPFYKIIMRSNKLKSVFKTILFDWRKIKACTSPPEPRYTAARIVAVAA